MTLQEVLAMLQVQRPQPVSVRPDYGLTGAMISTQQRSPYERTMRPGETRSPQELQSMLGEVILAAGAGASPLVGPRGVTLAKNQIRANRVPPTDFLQMILNPEPQREAVKAPTKRNPEVSAEIGTLMAEKQALLEKVYRPGPSVRLGRPDEYGGSMNAKALNEARRRAKLQRIEERIKELEAIDRGDLE